MACRGPRLRAWSTPTGIREGFDPGDDPASLPEPIACEIDASVGATIFSAWRGQVVRNVIDATLTRIGVGSSQPGSQEAYNALKNLLDTFATRRGVGASGVNFFVVDGAPTPEDARDLTQEVFLAVYKGLPELAEPAQFLGWLFVIARNVFHHSLEKQYAQKRSWAATDSALPRQKRGGSLRSSSPELP